MTPDKLSSLEEKFCLVYANGPAPYNGNAKMSYELVFKKKTGNIDNDIENNVIEDVDIHLAAEELAHRPDIKARIEEIRVENAFNASLLAPRLTASLLKIVDECSTLQVTNRFNEIMSPAALRSVAVNAASKLMDMYGLKEEIAHKVILEGADGDGITFNLVVPEANKDNEIEKLIQ